MPLSISWKLELGEVKQTTISLQMTDRSITYSWRVIEDVLVIFSVKFVALDMKEDQVIPIILGRPFLASEGASIDVQCGEMTLRVNEENVKFNIYHYKKATNTSTYHRIDVSNSDVVNMDRNEMEES